MLPPLRVCESCRVSRVACRAVVRAVRFVRVVEPGSGRGRGSGRRGGHGLGAATCSATSSAICAATCLAGSLSPATHPHLVSPATLPTQDVVVGEPPTPSRPQDVGELHQSNSTPVNEFVPASRRAGCPLGSGPAVGPAVRRWCGGCPSGGWVVLRRERQVERASKAPAQRSRPASRERQNVSHRSVVRAAAVYPPSTVRNAACGAIGEQRCELPVDFR